MKKFILTLLATVLSFYVVSAQHFTPVWDGNGLDHMNIYIFEATLDGVDLQPGDEVGVFDGQLCVGVGEVTTVITVNDPLEIRPSKDDPTTTDSIDGFKPTKTILFKVWDASEGVEISNVQPVYTTGLGKFVGNGSASLTLEANSPNNAPEFTSSAIVTATEDVEYVYDITTSDPDAGANLILKAPVLPPWLKFINNNDGSGTLKGTPKNPAVGLPNIVKLTLTDGIIDSLVVQTFGISVTNVNDTPKFVSSAATAAKTGTEYIYNVKVVDVDLGDSVAVTATLPTWLTLTGIGSGEATISGTPTTTGDYDVTVTATDKSGVSVTQSFTIKVSDTNTPPEFTTEEITTAIENQLYVYNMAGFDADEGTSLIFGATVIPAWLNIIDNSDGTAVLKGKPLHDDLGTHDVTLFLTDGIDTAKQTFVITVTATNNAPQVLTTDLDTATQDVAYSMEIKLSDVDSDQLFVKLAKHPPWLSIQGGVSSDSIVANLTDGLDTITLVGTPAAIDVRTTQVVLRVNDGEFLRTAIFALTVVDVNDPPVAKDRLDTLREDKQKFVPLVGLDKESPNTLSYDIAVQPPNGTLTAISINLYEYRPNLDFFGIDSFSFVVTDDGGLTDTGLVKLEVLPINDAPEISISNRKLEMFENDTLNFTVTLSDAKDGANAATLKVVQGYGPFNGKLEGDFDAGFLEYIPNEDFVGTDVMFLMAQEDHVDSLKSKPLMVQVAVKNVNTPPVIFDRQVHVLEDRWRIFRIFAFDKEDDIIDELTYQVIDSCEHADSFRIFNGNKVYYKPELNYDQKDSFRLAVIDTEGARDTAKIIIHIHARNDRPIAILDSLDAGGLDVDTIDFSPIVSDAETPDSLLEIIFLQQSGGDTLGIFGGTITAGSSNLEFYYDGSTNIYNVEYIMYRVFDGKFRSRPQVLKINNLVGAPLAKGLKAGQPIASGDSTDVDFGEEIEVLFVGLDVNYPFDSCTFEIIEAPTYGSLSFSKGQKATYDPGSPVTSSSALYAPTTSDDQVLVDKAKFKTTDTDGNSDTAEVVITVNPAADDPDISDVGDQQTNEDEPITLTITYEDLDSPADSITWGLKSNSSVTGMTWNYTDTTDTEIKLTITPPEDYAGNLLLVASCTDEGGLEDSVEFTLEAINVNDAPELADIEDQTTIQGTELTLVLYGEDIDSDSLSFSAVSKTSGAIDTITFDGNEMTITPESAYSGNDTIEVTVSDNESSPLTQTKSFALEIVLDDDAPRFSTTLLHEEIDEDDTLALSVTPLDSKSDEQLILSIVSSNQNLIPDDSITIDKVSDLTNVIRNIVFRPVAEASGVSKITIYIDDEELNQSVQQFNVTVNEVDDAPVLDPVSAITMDEDYTKAVSLSASDVDSYDLTYSASSNNDDVTVSVEANLLSIVSTNDYYGVTPIKIYVTDDNSTDSVTVDVTVENVQDRPKFLTTTLPKATEDVAYSVDINVSDPDPDVLTYFGETLPSWLTLTGNTLSGTPANTDATGQVIVILGVKDNVMTDTILQTYGLFVESTNDAPVFTSTPVTNAYVGHDYSYSITVTDEESDDIDITGTSLPGWMTLTDNNDGTATLSGKPTSAGNVTITITASDASDATVSTNQEFTLNITTGTAIDEALINSMVSISPNPNNGLFEVKLGELITGEVMINVYNIEGKMVYSTEIVKSISQIRSEIDLTGTAAGYYNIEIQSGDIIVNKKVLIE